MESNNEKVWLNFELIDMNNYVLPDKTNYLGKKYILNGEQNSFFQYVKDRYNGSTTNSSIINSYVNYIIGEGLEDTSGQNINKYISKRDLRLISQDFKMYGQFSIQVIWSQGSKLLKEEAKPLLIKHIPTEKIGLNVNSIGEIDGYWYSFDWTYQSKYKPKLYPKFDGIYKDSPVEILTVTRISSEPYFPQPDYLSGLQYAHIEEELANSHINHILNGFSAGTVINCRGGIPPTDELREEYKNKIIRKLTGSENKNKVIVNFSNGLDSGQEIEVTKLQIDQLDSLMVYHSEEAQRKIMQSHQVVNPILFGVKDASGFSNNADEMQQALKVLYRSNINPMREIILDGLESIFRYIDPSINLAFKDFEELVIKNDTPQ